MNYELRHTKLLYVFIIFVYLFFRSTSQNYFDILNAYLLCFKINGTNNEDVWKTCISSRCLWQNASLSRTVRHAVRVGLAITASNSNIVLVEEKNPYA